MISSLLTCFFFVINTITLGTQNFQNMEKLQVNLKMYFLFYKII